MCKSMLLSNNVWKFRCTITSKFLYCFHPGRPKISNVYEIQEKRVALHRGETCHFYPKTFCAWLLLLLITVVVAIKLDKRIQHTYLPSHTYLIFPLPSEFIVNRHQFRLQTSFAATDPTTSDAATSDASSATCIRAQIITSRTVPTPPRKSPITTQRPPTQRRFDSAVQTLYRGSKKWP